MRLNKMVGAKLMAVLMVLSVSACAEEEKPTRPIGNADLVPFFIGFTGDGKPVVIDENGDVIEPTRVDFPIKATAIESMGSITMVQYRGSHFKLIKVGNSVYSIPLPH